MDDGFRPNAFPSEAITKKILEAIPGAEVFVNDKQGNGYHFELVVVWDGFADLSRIKQHQKILNLFSDEFSKNLLHAMTLKTLTKKAGVE
jgi:acid stress-induced BolA-like protein IbaG/YrbA